MIKIKKTIAVTTILLAGISLWCNDNNSARSDFFENYTYYLSFSDKDISTGTKLSFNMADITMAAKNNELNFGISLFTENYTGSFPCKGMIGNISTGGSFSELSSPGISSSSSGFSSCYSPPNKITCTIPSFSSFYNPLRSFIEFCYKKDSSIIEEFCINGLYNFFTNNSAFSTKLSINFSNNINMANIFTFCLFNMKEQIPTAWYGEPYYKADKLFCLSSSLKISIPLYSGNFTIFSYETPFGKIENIYKTEHEFKTQYFNISGSFLFNNSLNIISQKSSVIDPSIDIKGNINFTIPIELKNNEKMKIKTGITGFGKIPLLENINDMIFGISSILEHPITNIGADVGLNYEIDSSITKIYPSSISVKIKNSWDIGVFDPSINIYSKYYFSKTDEPLENGSSVKISHNTNYYKADFNCCLIEDMLNGTASFSFYYKNNEITDKKLKCSLSSNITLKNLIMILKINGEFCI